MKLLLCPCRACKRRRRLWNPVIKSRIKGARQRVRHALRTGQYEGLPEKLYIGYTDLSPNGYWTSELT